jgi:hypothetical protein
MHMAYGFLADSNSGGCHQHYSLHVSPTSNHSLIRLRALIDYITEQTRARKSRRINTSLFLFSLSFLPYTSSIPAFAGLKKSYDIVFHGVRSVFAREPGENSEHVLPCWFWLAGNDGDGDGDEYHHHHHRSKSGYLVLLFSCCLC